MFCINLKTKCKCTIKLHTTELYGKAKTNKFSKYQTLFASMVFNFFFFFKPWGNYEIRLTKGFPCPTVSVDLQFTLVVQINKCIHFPFSGREEQSLWLTSLQEVTWGLLIVTRQWVATPTRPTSLLVCGQRRAETTGDGDPAGEEAAGGGVDGKLATTSDALNPIKMSKLQLGSCRRFILSSQRCCWFRLWCWWERLLVKVEMCWFQVSHFSLIHSIACFILRHVFRCNEYNRFVMGRSFMSNCNQMGFLPQGKIQLSRGREQ